MGSIISQVQYDRVMKYIAAGKEDGARLVSGGKRPDDPKLAKGLFIEPTIFADVTMDMRIGKEEIFGPVLSVFKWSDEDEMLAQVNQVEYGLTCSIWTNDLADRAPHRRGGRGRLCLDQRGVEAFPRRAVRRLQAVRHRPRGMHRGAAALHAREEHPREPEAAKQAGIRTGRYALSGPPCTCGRAAIFIAFRQSRPATQRRRQKGEVSMRRIVCILVAAFVPASCDAQQQPKPDWAFPVPDKVKVEPRFAPDRVRTVGNVSYTRAAVDDLLQHPDLAPADASADGEDRPVRQQGHPGARLRLLPSADRHRP